MPKGPKGEKRPTDAIGAAIRVAKIATGEEPEQILTPKTKNEAAAMLGRLGGKARAESLSKKKRKEIAQKDDYLSWVSSAEPGLGPGADPCHRVGSRKG